MKQQNVDFVNPFPNIYFKYVLMPGGVAVTETVWFLDILRSQWQPDTRFGAWERPDDLHPFVAPPQLASVGGFKGQLPN